MIIRLLARMFFGLVLGSLTWGAALAEDMRGTWDIDTYQVGAALCSGMLEVRERTPEGGYLGRLVLKYRTPHERLEVNQDVHLSRSGELWAVDGIDPVVDSNATLSRATFGYQADRFLCADIWPELLECVTVHVGLPDSVGFETGAGRSETEAGTGQIPVRMTKDQ